MLLLKTDVNVCSVMVWKKTISGKGLNEMSDEELIAEYESSSCDQDELLEECKAQMA